MTTALVLARTRRLVARAGGVAAVAALVVTTVAVGAAQAAAPISTSGLGLTRHATSSALVGALDSALPNVSVDTVAADANRQGPTGSSCTSVLPHVTKKFCWRDDDNDTTQWYPQGVTSTYDAYGGAGTTSGGRSLLATSWYDHDGGTNKGARVSLLNRSTGAYRHVLLVVPSGTTSSPSFTVASTHAGGLAWYGKNLFVADTDGIRVFDMSHLWRVNDSLDTSIGRTSSGYGAYGYKYVAPQIQFYARVGDFRYSSIALDRTTSPDSLVATEYRAPSDTAQASPRTVRYNLNESTRLLAESSGSVGADGAWVLGINSLQGGVFVSGRLYLSQSDGASTSGTDNDRGDMYRYTPSTGDLAYWGNDLPVGTEDLSYWAGRAELWTTAEYPGLRGLYALDWNYYNG